MPEISRFFGIVIRMYYSEHGPPHFHARYGRSKASIRLAPVGLLSGRLPPRALALTVEWGTLHEAELLANWDRLRARRPALKVAPLE